MSDNLPFDVMDEEVEVDLSNLIDLNMSFQPLRLNLERILKRVRHLEGDNQVKTQQIRDLQDALSKLLRKDAEEKDNHDAIWEELERLGDLIGDLKNDHHRPTIEQFYHARKEKEENDRKSPTLSSAGSKRQDQEAGESILDKARETLPVEVEDEESNDGDEEDNEEDGEAVEGQHAEEEDGGERANNSSGREGSSQSSKPNSASQSKKSHLSIGDSEGEHQGGDDDAADDDAGKGGEELHAEEGDGGEAPGESTTSGAPVDRTNSESFGRSKGESGTELESGEPRGTESGDKSLTSSRPGGSASSKKDREPKRRSSRVSGKGGRSRPTSTSTQKRAGSGRSRDDREGARSAESSTAMSPSRRSFGGSQSGSVFDKLRRDGDDISYLNRVVAEILAEMKGLHSDVDLLRTMNGSEASETSGLGKGRKGGKGGEGEGDWNEKDEAQLRDHIRNAGALTADDIDAVKSLTDNNDKMRELEKIVSAMEKQNERVQEKINGIMDVADGTTDINPAQFGILAGTVKSLEKQLDDLYRSGVKDWSAEFGDVQQQLKKLQRDLDEMRERLQRTERTARRLEDKTQRVGFAPGVNGEGGTAGESGADGINAAALQLSDDLWRRLEEMNDRMDNSDAEIKRMEDEKADRNALQRLRDDLQNMKRLMDLNAKRDAGRLNIEGEGGDAGESKRLFQELQQQLLTQMKNANADKENAREEMNNLMEFVRQLDHRKADATLVANKAERDYVENALERLMREVEQVLNATNAGLIDTLDKSLNILRDMIDGKATKQDISRLQQLIEEEGGGKAAADGLMGFKGYRCLGCNRPVDSMRPRTLPATMDQLLNRNPQSYPQDGVTRNIHQQQQATALLEQHHAIQ